MLGRWIMGLHSNVYSDDAHSQIVEATQSSPATEHG